MKTNDFSAPRRMKQRWFVIFLVNNLWLYAKYFLFIVILELFNSEKKLSFIEAALDFLVVFGKSVGPWQQSLLLSIIIPKSIMWRMEI